MTLLKLNPGHPARSGGMPPLKLASIIGPCKATITFFFPEQGIHRFLRNPVQISIGVPTSHVVLGTPALHFAGLSAF